ncbi:MAG: ABC transporter ATP-binding protein [Clostridium sp.]|uniref:ABC transporter ATP-binding protein n=1 Tax=Clostridium culturomicium TaxID=1499683 RepID=UPI00058D45BA|nr:ABC transporter ATP-binding protein [Clostridium culturomicium]MDU4890471.1 ABC transporter ATP-binding protein [Clostridium sp.]MDU7084087.1 ABC transporter ATP-binding protein [Clostridium sp.]
MSSFQSKISLNHISKSYDNMKILKDITLHVNEGELISIVGPSGSGKSTIFNIITKLTNIDGGEVDISGKVSYMYQKDMMVPWKKVIDNIAIPLVLKGIKKSEARREVEKYIETFGLKGFEYKYPTQLSGGMKQRANFLKTFLTSNEIMLLDEPFGALDSITRKNLQKWLIDLKQKMNSTILFITHDIDEAILISDRVYVITEKPAVIKGEIKIQLPECGENEVSLCKEYIDLKRSLIKLLEN